MNTILLRGLLVPAFLCHLVPVNAEDLRLPVTPKSERTVVSDGHHNAFAAFVRWKGGYWLAFRRGTGHVARDGDLVVLRSADTHDWAESVTIDLAADDRDAQLLPTDRNLFLYINCLDAGKFNVSVTHTADGKTWSDPRQVYRDGFILWKPVEHEGRYYAGAHRPGSNESRESHLVVSEDGVHWEKVSTIRSGRGESETTLLFNRDGRATAFLRSQVTVGGAILDSTPPYTHWKERPARIHLSGHAVYQFEDTVYLIGRYLAYDPPGDPATPRAELSNEGLSQATMVYTYRDRELAPYCLLGPLEGNHDSSYAAAVRDGSDMIIIYHRAAHEFTGDFRFRDAADIFLARVPLDLHHP